MQISELQQAVVELANQNDSAAAAAVRPEIEALQKQVADSHGYIIEEHSLVLYVRPRKPAAGSRG